MAAFYGTSTEYWRFSGTLTSVPYISLMLRSSVESNTNRFLVHLVALANYYHQRSDFIDKIGIYECTFASTNNLPQFVAYYISNASDLIKIWWNPVYPAAGESDHSRDCFRFAYNCIASIPWSPLPWNESVGTSSSF